MAMAAFAVALALFLIGHRIWLVQELEYRVGAAATASVIEFASPSNRDYWFSFAYPEANNPHRALVSSFRYERTDYPQAKHDVWVTAGAYVFIYPPNGAEFKNPHLVAQEILDGIKNLVDPNWCRVAVHTDHGWIEASYGDSSKPARALLYWDNLRGEFIHDKA
jgi:hypothetical protein